MMKEKKQKKMMTPEETLNARELAAKRVAKVIFRAAVVLAAVLVGLTLYSFYFRPLFTLSLTTNISFMGYYFLKFSSFWHKNPFLENMFWSTEGFLLAFTFFVTRDSPLFLLSRFSPSTVFLCLCGTAFAFSSIHAYLYAASLVISEAMQRNRSAALLFFDKDESFLQLTNLLEENMQVLETRLFNFGVINKAEESIIELFKQADRKELKNLIVKYPLKKVLFKIENARLSATLQSNFFKRITATGNKKRFLELLSDQRCNDLGVTARYYVIDAIQSIRLTSDDKFAAVAQEAIKKIFLATKLEELSELKTRIDNKGSVLSTHHLLYKDIKDEKIREQIFDHIQSEAESEEFSKSVTSKLLHRPWRKILSDIDDTLFSSGGRYPAGIDESYPHHALYPGALAFFKELDLGNDPSVDETDGKWPEGQPGNLCFLSARPHVYKDVMERSVFKKFKSMQQRQLLHATPMLLPGDLQSGQSFVLQGELTPMAEKKYQNFEQYARIYPEFSYVFIGDTGQADVKAAEMMLESFPKQIEAVFIHKVSPIEESFGYSAKWEEMNIHFFTTYIEAAIKALELGLITVGGLARVGKSIVKDFNRIDWKSNRKYQDEARTQLNEDIIKANELIKQLRTKSKNVIKTIKLIPDRDLDASFNL